MMRHVARGLLLVCGLVSVSCAAYAASDEPPEAAKSNVPAAAQGAESPKSPETGEKALATDALPGIHIDRTQRLIDIDAVVIDPSEDWLEMLACVKGTVEHESLLTVESKPSHIHLALLMLQAEPGKPHQVDRIDEPLKPGEDPEDESRGIIIDGVRIRWVSKPASGAKIRVSIIEQKDGKAVETPANRWILNRKTNKPLEGDVWLFTGSQFMEHDDKEVYLADVNGTVITLVHFGDDVLARDTTLTNSSDGEAFAANEGAVPPAGTKVKIRLRPVKPAPKANKPDTGADQGDTTPPARAAPQPGGE